MFSDLNDVLQNCCDLGTHNSNISCSPDEIDLYSTLNYSTRFLTECTISFQLCCSKAKTDLACQKGKMMAKNNDHCDFKWNEIESSKHSNHPTLACCQACKLGLIAKKQAKSCTYEAKLGHLEDGVFRECCDDSLALDTVSIGVDVIESSNRPIDSDNNFDKLDENSYETSSCRGSHCEECLETSFSGLCRCRHGFQPSLDHRFCVDKNECQDEATCKPHEDCLNIIGSYYCAPKFPKANWCPNGYMKRYGQCIDINECKEGLVVCREPNEICINLNGSYSCQNISKSRTKCDIGYEWRANSCQDIDECRTGEHTCNTLKERCINLPGTFICSFALSSGLYSRNSSNRSSSLSSGLSSGFSSEMSSSLSSSLISNDCPKGYKMNEKTKVCEDVDECKTVNICSEVGTCINYLGGYRCSCPSGYEIDATRGCVDINECELDLDNCPETHRCDNRLGSYACVRSSNCGTGYIYNQDTDKCEDINECENQLHPCSSSFKCINVPGSFKCKRIECPPGQVLLSDETCRSSNCSPGLIFNTILERCVDIDECLSNPCSSHYICENQFGSYRCRPREACEPGLELSPSGKECIDIDECKKGTHQCDIEMTCKNTYKSYECECSTGFRLSPLRKCEDIDECKHYGPDLCPYSSNCINTIGSYYCECKEGFKKSETDERCVDVNECEDRSALCSHECYNIHGSYICGCPVGK